MTPRIYTTVREFRLACDQVRAAGKTLALVPTLGALHRAHETLMQMATSRADVLAVSIFVNPTQFGQGEDYERYPRDLSGDVAICARQKAQLIFAPSREEMYPINATTRVCVDMLCDALCGRHRPGHFEGVATVVTKLLAVTGPCVAVFGRKDYQQLRVIHRLVNDLLLPVEIVEQNIVREADGLALSSRNRYLSEQQRYSALGIPRALSAVAVAFSAGQRGVGQLLALATDQLQSAGLSPQYVEIVKLEDFSPVSGDVKSGQAGLFVAVRLGKTRLIDNLILGVDGPPVGCAAPSERLS